MSFDPATAPHLKPWLVRTLEPICDAEPGALAEYILALLKHNVPESEMRKELIIQLEEFLEKETSTFIDTLFTVLRTKSYLPYTATSPSPSYPSSSQSIDTGIPIPLDGLLSPSNPTSPGRGQKRAMDHDERDGRPPAKGPRLSNDGQFSRYSNGRGMGHDARSTGGWGGRDGRQGMNGAAHMSVGGGMNGNFGNVNGRTQTYLPPDQKRGICRDYHNNGYCARGAFCKFSHGDDAVVPTQLFPMNGQPMASPGMPFMPMFPTGAAPFGIAGGTGAAYDPHEARMDMRSQGGRSTSRAPMLPRVQQEDGSQVPQGARASGELPVIQDLTPKPPPDEASPSATPSDVSGQVNGGLNPMPIPMQGIQQPQLPSYPMEVDLPGPISQHLNPQGSYRGGASRGRGRGTFGGDVHSFRPERRNDKTLVVEKIPEDKLALEAVNSWFKRFGTVTHVAIDAVGAKALVSFSNHDEAHAAWKSEDAVFNNRFVKLFWHRPVEGHGQVGARMLAASAPLVNKMTLKTPTPAAPTPDQTASVAPPPPTSTPARRPSTTSAAASALAAKQRLLEQQIAEQRALMASLDTATPEEKKETMARLRKLGDEMKAAPSSSSPTTPLLPSPSAPAATGAREQRERERLDKELELHNVTTQTNEGRPEESTADLKAKLERLKAEAASLGLPEATPESHQPGTSYRPYRGRGRVARSLYRGAVRGGPPRSSMKLDNRPKKLLIKGVGEDSVQAVRDWYETTGSMESLVTEDNGDLVISFKTRSAAEQGLAKGQNIPPIGQVQVAWYTGQRTTPVQKALEMPSSDTMHDGNSGEQTIVQTASVNSPQVQDEEIIASGWGGDAEDGMGML